MTYRAESSLASALSSRAERAEAISILRQLIRDAREHPDVVPASELARYLNNFAATVNARTFIQNDFKLAAESEACLARRCNRGQGRESQPDTSGTGSIESREDAECAGKNSRGDSDVVRCAD